MGINPDDEGAPVKARAIGTFEEWTDLWNVAAKEVRYSEAYDKWNRASRKTARVGKKILKLKAATCAGLMIQARVIDQHDAVGEGERDEQFMQLITNFAERRRIAV